MVTVTVTARSGLTGSGRSESAGPFWARAAGGTVTRWLRAAGGVSESGDSPEGG